jgi:hypothetical protein
MEEPMSTAEQLCAAAQQAESSPGLERATASASRWLATGARIFAETASLIAFVAVAAYLYKGDIAFNSLRPHPLWIPVFLMSAQYGALGGVFAAFGATAALYGFAMPSRAASQDFYSYAGVLVVQPMQWMIYAVVIGGLRSLHMLRAAELQNDLADSTRATTELADGLERAIAEIGRLESRIAGDSSTLNAALRALAKVDFKDRQTLTASFAPLVSDAIGATRFTIYLYTPAGLEPCYRFDAEADGGASRAPKIGGPLLERLKAGRELVDSLDANRVTLTPLGALCAAPIRPAASAEPFGILLIEKLEPHRHVDEASKRARLLGLALGNALCGAKLGERSTALVRA